MKLKLSIIIVNWNTCELLRRCLNSLISNFQFSNFQTEIIVVDNGSSDNSVDFVKKFKVQNSKFKIHLIENNKNLGFGKANNQGMEVAQGEYILLLNSDTIVKNKAIKKTIEYLDSNPEVGAVTCKLLNQDGTTQPTGGFFPNLLNIFTWAFFLDDLPFINKVIKPFHPHTENFWLKENWYTQTRELDWVTGAFLMVRSKVVDQVGKLSNDFFMYVEEVEWCYRIKQAGWKIVFFEPAEIIHLGGGSGNSTNSIIGEDKGLKLFFKIHYSIWQLRLLKVLLILKNIFRILLFFVIGKPKKSFAYAKVLFFKKHI